VVQEAGSRTAALEEAVTEKTEGLDEGVQAVAARCTGVHSRVDKLRDELSTLVGAEADKRSDSIATTHAMLDAGMKRHQEEQSQLSSALEVCHHPSLGPCSLVCGAQAHADCSGTTPATSAGC
jgi:hypothetical protein